MNIKVAIDTDYSPTRVERHKEYAGVIQTDNFNTYECKCKRQPWTNKEYLFRKEYYKNKGGR